MAGQPRIVFAAGESDPMAGIVCRLDGDHVYISSQSCLGRCSRSDGACAECVKVSSNRMLWKYIKRQSYFVDLCLLAHRLSHGSDEQVESARSLIQSRDYKCQDDMQKLDEAPTKLEKVRALSDLVRIKRYQNISEEIRSAQEISGARGSYGS